MLFLKRAPLKFGDDEDVPDVDEDGQVNEDIEWDSYLPNDDTGKIEREIRQKELPPLERVSSEITHDLQSHLMSQLLLGKMNVVQKEIGADIIGNLNEDGYFETSIDKSLSVPLYDVHAAFSAVADFDPRPGQQFNKKIYFNEEISAYRDSVFHIKPDFLYC